MRRFLLILLLALASIAQAAPQWLGTFAEDAEVVFYWNTYDDDGASVTRATDGTVKVIRDDQTDVTGTSVTDTEDSLDTGVHLCKVDTSDGVNYATGYTYTVWIDGAVIDGDTVNGALATFSIEDRFADVTTVTNSDKTGYTLTNLSDANAGKLEDILDGTGATGLTLNSLVITGTAAGGVVDIDNAGGPGIKIDATTFGIDCRASAGRGAYILGTTYGIFSQATAGVGFQAQGTTRGAVFLGAGADAYGLLCQGFTGGAGYGAAFIGDTPISGNITGNITGNIVGTLSTLTTYTGNTPQTADNNTILASAVHGNAALRTLMLDVPTVAEFEARTLLAADYFLFGTDAVANVTLVGTTTTNTDMRGTDAAALAATALSTAVWTAAKAGYLTGAVALEATAQSILTDTGTTLPARFTGIEGATFLTATDSLEAIRNRGDAAWTTGAGGDATAANQVTIIANVAAVKVDTAATLTDTGTTLPATLSGMSGATFDTTTDSLEAIRNRGDAAWVTGGGGTGWTAAQIANILSWSEKTFGIVQGGR